MQSDPNNPLVKPSYAVIYTPSRRRKRFPENCVTLAESPQQAIELSRQQPDKHPALVMGPSRSSEGFRLYYLIEWLN